MRLVSLLPGATEIVYALGLGADLVGVSFECDEPASARVDATVVVGGRDTRAMSPREIDDYVRSRAAAGADLYTLHADALATLAPDLIVTQDLCRVCAVPAGQVGAALAHLGCTADVLCLDPHSLEDVFAGIHAVAIRAGVPERAAVLVASLRNRLTAIRTATGGRPRPRVAVVEWVDPPYGAGHWVPDLVTAAGGDPVGARPGALSVRTTWPQIAADQPDVVLVAPCGYGLAGAVAQARAVAAQLPGPAVWAIDANGLVVRPGPRLVAGVEAIASILHPDRVPAAHPAVVIRVA